MCNKMNIPIISNRMLKFLAVMNLCFLMYQQTAANAYSTSFDFGPVAVGTTSTAMITIHNEEKDDILVTATEFLSDSCSDFSIAFRTELKLIPGGGTLEIDVNYSPLAVGECSNVLKIWTNSPFAHTVTLSGTGVGSRALMEDKIQEILEYLDTQMKGKGPGSSAENRFNALRKMIQAAARHIKNGQTEVAWHKLSEIYKKADGFSKPMDFIDEGPTQGPTKRIYSTKTLAGLIEDLMTLLESDAIKTGRLAKSKATP